MGSARANVISASRRTDLPALHARWLLSAVREGGVEVQHPFDARKKRHVSLRPDDVAALVLWTRLPHPLLANLDELVSRFGVPLWLVTLTGYPRELEPRTPAPWRVIDDMHRLADRLGADSVHWRFDPIVLTSITPAARIIDTFGHLAERLRGATRVCHISFVDRSY
jgi:hypothetical protein